MQAPVEVRYAGVVVATATEVRDAAEGGGAFFLAVREPMPVGAVVGLGSEGARARVERVVESEDAARAGMFVRLLAGGDGDLPPLPAPPAPPRRERSLTPAPVAEERTPGPAGDAKRKGKRRKTSH